MSLVFDDGSIPDIRFPVVSLPVVDVPLVILPSQSLDSLVTVQGNLRDAYKQIVSGTIRHVDELMNERRLHPIARDGSDLRNLSFYCGDGIIYFICDNKPTLAITRAKQNLVLRHIDDAFTQLTTQQDYIPDPLEAEAAIADPETVLIDLSELRLKKENDEFSYLAISTKGYGSLNAEERKFAERVYGQGDDFVANMSMLQAAGIVETKVYVLTPAYAKENANKGFLSRASFVYSFNNGSIFDAVDRNVDNNNRVRGVPIVNSVREADTTKKIEQTGVPQQLTATLCYDTLLAHPNEALNALDDTRAAGLSQLLAQYLSSRR